VLGASLASGRVEDLLIPIGVEAHDEDVSYPEGWRPQGAAAPQNELGDVIVRCASCEVELDQLLALRDPDLLGLPGVIEGLISLDLDLVGDDELGLLDVSGSQELLGAGAACSGLAVVVPLDVGRHGGSRVGPASIRLEPLAPAKGDQALESR
jgi:hypothetical protein